MNNRLAWIAKLTLAVALQLLGINRLFRYLNRRNARILLYHGIIERPLGGMLNSESLHIPVARFARQVAYLCARYRLMPLDEFVRRAQAGAPLPDYTAILTFDDGYANNYRNAWPVLQRHRAPTTLYVSTSFIGSNELLWLDKLEYALDRTQQPWVELLVRGQPHRFSLTSSKEKMAALRRLKRLLKPLPDAERGPLLAALDRQFGVEDRPDASYYCNALAWEQLQEMADSGLVTVGSHAVHHVHLDTVEPSRIPEELAHSKRVLEERLQRSVRHFAYPGGACTPEIKQQTRSVGYDSAVATVHGFNDQRTDLFELRRNEVGYGGNLWFFKATVSGSWDAVKVLGKRLLRR